MTGLDSLTSELGDAVERHAAERVASSDHRVNGAGRDHRSRPARKSVRWWLIGVAGAAAALAVLVQLLPANPANDARAAVLPALAHADHDVSDGPRLPVGADMDLHKAYAFPFGPHTAYVLATGDGTKVCIVLPDPPAGYGSTCAQASTVARQGLVAMLVAPTPDSPPSRVAVVLPDDVATPTIDYRDGTRQTLTVRNGVATATIRGDGTLKVTARDGTRAIPVQRSEPQGDLAIDCGDGRVIKADPGLPAVPSDLQCG